MRIPPNSFQNTTGSQLLDCSFVVELECLLHVVGFDAPHIVRVGAVQVLHQQVERVPEGGPHRLLVRLLVVHRPGLASSRVGCRHAQRVRS